ncbi:spore germination protein B3 precursor [Ruminiclostridium hungatei]|uniref:Spore germination protein B3 n=1 Tax=Ruminiclostridium hungatei TaxID=48256 RepID=A0A1V4SFL3_RUMHU|nr:Ger(x)C family spore germination protein [Ruminiclostridium hungatei]OPX42650.1 spore germination protein B3 precursor [Ruminiclostridium hungatei]
MRGICIRSLRIVLIEIITVMCLLLSGCWDRTEINDLALITASSYDTAPGGKLQYSVQILVPSGGSKGGQGGAAAPKKNFIVETAVGIDPGDAEKNVQNKFPRRLFRGHRRVIILGEELAKQGIDIMLDSIGRDPQNRLRTNVVVAKGQKGYDLLKTEYPIERIPTEAMREMAVLGVGIDANIHDMLIAASSKGMQPIALAIEKTKGEEGFKTTGLALFNDLKLAGYLDAEKTEGYLWIMGKQKNGIIATEVPRYDGVVRVNIKGQDARVIPKFKGKTPYILVEITGSGSIYGNSTKLDLSVPDNINIVQKAIIERIRKQVENTIASVQKEVGTDVFCFGMAFHQFKPCEWKKLEKQWDDIFPYLKVYISVDFKIKTSGMSGPPLYLKKDEIKK